MPRRRVLAGCALITCLVLTAGACEESDPAPGDGPSSPAPLTQLSFGVYGPAEEIAAYTSLVETYNEAAQGTQVSIKSWPDRAAMRTDLAAGAPRPDVFLLSRDDLLEVTTGEVNRPVLELLDERGVDFGDGYSRDALMALSEAGELQCMPYGISPQVLYYNTDLIDFERMAGLGLDAPVADEPLTLGPNADGLSPRDPTDSPTASNVPERSELPEEDPSAGPSTEASSEPTADEEASPPPTYTSWTFEQFVAAAEFASRPRRGAKGFYVEPTIAGLEPFIEAAGGRMYDDDDTPTSLAFSDDSTQEALSTILPVLRSAVLTPTEEELDGTTPVELFKEGKLGMLPGFRALTPELRAEEGLNFDVMPIPTIETDATVGEITALCISAKADSIAEAADFLVYVVSDEAVARVTTSGYLVPANLKVLLSEDFLDPASKPTNSTIFASTLRDLREGPLLDEKPALHQAVNPTIELLLTTPVLTDLGPLTVQIDEESRTVLNGEDTGEEDSPTSSPPAQD